MILGTIKRRIRKFKSDWKSMENWSNAPRVWTRSKKILKPILITISLLLTFIPAYFEQVSIVKVYEGISLPSGPISIGLNFSDPTNIYISFPYSVENRGFYDLADISLKVSLKLDYSHKDTGEKRRQIILSEYGNNGFVKAGRTYEDKYEKDFLEFDWYSIDTYLLEADSSSDTYALMDIEFSFFLAGVEKDRMLFSNINLTSDIEASLKCSSIQYNERLTVERSKVSIFNLFAFIIGFLLFFIFLKIKNMTRKKGVNIKTLRKKPMASLKKKTVINSIRRILSYSIIVIVWNIFLLLNQKNSSYISSEYLIRYEIVMWTSIVLLLVINIISLLPVMRPRNYTKYSIREGTRSLFASILSFITLLIWSTTAIIAYQIETNIYIIRDIFPSFIPLLIIFTLNIGIKSIDLIIYRIYKAEFQKVRSEIERKRKICPYMAPTTDEFNKLIFETILEINSNGLLATVSQIKSNFKNHNLATIAKSGVKVNRDYLKILENEIYLESKKEQLDHKEQKTIEIYMLTPKAEILIGKVKDFEEIIIDEEGLKSESDSKYKIECPNPNCEYMCYVSWESCPICKTKLLTKQNVIKFCISCRSELKSQEKAFKVCKDCQEIGISIQDKTDYCPVCGNSTISNQLFCIECYYPFFNSNSKYKNHSLDKLYESSIRNERNFKYLLVSSIHIVFIMLFLVKILKYFSIVITFDLIDSILVACIFSIFIIYNRINNRRIRKARIAKDPYYRIKLAVIHYKEDKLKDFIIDNLKKLQMKYRYTNKTMQNLIEKIRKIQQKIRILKIIFLLFCCLGLIFFVFNYMLFLFSFLISFSILYLIVQRKDIKYLNDIFRLGIQYKKEDYENYVLYVIKQLKYL